MYENKQYLHNTGIFPIQMRYHIGGPHLEKFTSPNGKTWQRYQKKLDTSNCNRIEMISFVLWSHPTYISDFLTLCADATYINTWQITMLLKKNWHYYTRSESSTRCTCEYFDKGIEWHWHTSQLTFVYKATHKVLKIIRMPKILVLRYF